jgi:hypothetical protein
MPTIQDYMQNFSLADFILLAVVVAVIVIWREEKRIFRRRNNATKERQGPSAA